MRGWKRKWFAMKGTIASRQRSHGSSLSSTSFIKQSEQEKDCDFSPKESAVLREVFYAFGHQGFTVLPRKGWTRPIPVEANVRGIVWRENVGAFKSSRRFIRLGFPGRPDIGGFTKSGRFIAFEVKRSEKKRLTPMQNCIGQWMQSMNVAWARVWSYDSTLEAIKALGI